MIKTKNDRFLIVRLRVHVLLAAAGIGLVAGLASAGESSRPNILFLLTDDQRYDDLGCMGNKVIQTPHIDRLAAQGVTV